MNVVAWTPQRLQTVNDTKIRISTNLPNPYEFLLGGSTPICSSF